MGRTWAAGRRSPRRIPSSSAKACIRCCWRPPTASAWKSRSGSRRARPPGWSARSPEPRPSARAQRQHLQHPDVPPLVHEPIVLEERVPLRPRLRQHHLDPLAPERLGPAHRLREQIASDALVPLLRVHHEDVDGSDSSSGLELRAVGQRQEREQPPVGERVVRDEALQLGMLHHPGEDRFLVLRRHHPSLARQQAEEGLAIAAIQWAEPPFLAAGREQRRDAGRHGTEDYFFATFEDNSESMIALKESKGRAPTSLRPLMKNVGVPLAPSAFPALMSAWIRDCAPRASTAAFQRETSSPIS